MTLSKRQNRIIWGTTIIVVFLLGLRCSRETLKGNGFLTTTTWTTYFYWIRLDQRVNVIDKRVRSQVKDDQVERKIAEFVGGLPSFEDSFPYVLAKNKILEIIAVVIIGAAAFITSKRK